MKIDVYDNTSIYDIVEKNIKEQNAINERKGEKLAYQNQENTSEPDQIITEKKSKNFSQEEKECFYMLLGLLYYNIDVNREYKIISVESIYGIFIIIKKLSLKMKILQIMRTMFTIWI